MDAVETVRRDMDRLRGQLFQFAEAVGMPERQEQAFKGLVRQLTYDSQGRLEAAMRAKEKITNGTHSAV